MTGCSADLFDPIETLESRGDLGDTTLSERVAKLMADGTGSWEWRLRQPDRGWAWMRTHARRLEGGISGQDEFVGYVFNVSRERDAESRALVAARLASLGEMSANIAHELRQPLQVVSVSAEMAQLAARRFGDPDLDRRLGKIVDRAHGMADVIEHLLRFARRPEGAGETEEVSLDEVVRGALVLAHEALNGVGVAVEVSHGELALRALGQRVSMEQVLANLIMNAKDALAELPIGAPRRLRISTAADAIGMVRLTVADTGGGIAPAIMPHIFEPFVTTKGPDVGTGLGLSICHGLVRAMNGTLEARNDTDGAVFTVTLPAAPFVPAAGSKLADGLMA